MENRASLEYFVADVFTGESYKGNPLAVVFTNSDLTPQQYGNIAREFGYSETSFVYYDEKQQGLNIRSFTPIGFEVHGAGHNLLGAACAALLKGMDIFCAQGANPFVLMKGARIRLFVKTGSASQLPVVQMQQRPAVMGKTIPAALAADALGVTGADLTVQNLVPTIVKTEVAHAMVPVINLAALNNIKPDNKKLIEISGQYQCEGFYCFVLTAGEKGNIAESRFFNPLIGIDEDAATGTAAGPLAGFLVAHNIIQPNKVYQILQGVKLNQPSVIEVTVTDNGILVGGSSIITMQGRIFL